MEIVIFMLFLVYDSLKYQKKIAVPLLGHVSTEMKVEIERVAWGRRFQEEFLINICMS